MTIIFPFHKCQISKMKSSTTQKSEIILQFTSIVWQKFVLSGILQALLSITRKHIYRRFAIPLFSNLSFCHLIIFIIFFVNFSFVNSLLLFWYSLYQLRISVGKIKHRNNVTSTICISMKFLNLYRIFGLKLWWKKFAK